MGHYETPFRTAYQAVIVAIDARVDSETMLAASGPLPPMRTAKI